MQQKTLVRTILAAILAVSLSAPVWAQEPIGSIQIRFRNWIGGAPLASNTYPFPFFGVTHRPFDGDTFDNLPILIFTDSDGRATLIRDDNGTPLPAGEYVILANTGEDGAEMMRSRTFSVQPSEHFQYGAFLVAGPPILFTLLQPCEPVPLSGGVCRFAVRVTNGMRPAKRFVGSVWLIANAFGLETDVSRFLIGTKRAVDLQPKASVVFEFQVKVPRTVGNDVLISVEAFAGYRKSAAPELHPVMETSLLDEEGNPFYITKQGSSNEALVASR